MQIVNDKVTRTKQFLHKGEEKKVDRTSRVWRYDLHRILMHREWRGSNDICKEMQRVPGPFKFPALDLQI